MLGGTWANSAWSLQVRQTVLNYPTRSIVCKSRDCTVFSPWDAGGLSCGVLHSPLARVALLPVRERSRRTEEGSTKVVGDLKHMCFRETREWGLFSLVKST